MVRGMWNCEKLNFRSIPILLLHMSNEIYCLLFYYLLFEELNIEKLKLKLKYGNPNLHAWKLKLMTTIRGNLKINGQKLKLMKLYMEILIYTSGILIHTTHHKITQLILDFNRRENAFLENICKTKVGGKMILLMFKNVFRFCLYKHVSYSSKLLQTNCISTYPSRNGTAKSTKC